MKKFFTLFLMMMPIIVYAQVTNSPNMNLPIPIPGVTSGPQWAQNINSSLTLIDQHNHTPGYGVQIPPAGLNINSNLPFNNNSATSLQASVYMPQSSYSTNYGVHVEGVDLYYVDGNGNDIKMTAGGTVNATSSGITNGTATASFSSGVLVVNSASNTPANIQAGSYLMGNNIANSKFLTLQPPNSMAANYSITLPSIPGAQSFLTLDTSGNIASYAAIANGLTGSNIVSSVNLSGKSVQESSSNVVVSNTNATNSLAIIRAIIRGTDGALIGGEGISASGHPSTGNYTLTYTTAFGDSPSIVVTTQINGSSANYNTNTSSGATIHTVDTSGAAFDTDFHVIIIGQRQ